MNRSVVFVGAVLVVSGCSSVVQPPATEPHSSTTVLSTTLIGESLVSTTRPAITTTTQPVTATSLAPSTTVVESPMLEIVDPTQGAVITKDRYTFRGVTDPGCTVHVGGTYLAEVDEAGNWAIELRLLPGGNATTFTATCPSGATSTAEVGVEHRIPIEQAIVGQWVGALQTPETLFDPVWMEFRADGTYSIRGGIVLHWERDDTLENWHRRYEVWAPPGEFAGTGLLSLTSPDNSYDRDGRFENVTVDSAELHFEFWKSLPGRFYGPYVFDAQPMPVGFCIDDPYEQANVWGPTNLEARIGPNLLPGQSLQFEAVLCPDNLDRFLIQVNFPPGECPAVEYTLTVTATTDSEAVHTLDLFLRSGMNYSGPIMGQERARPGQPETVTVVESVPCGIDDLGHLLNIGLEGTGTSGQPYSVMVGVSDARVAGGHS